MNLDFSDDQKFLQEEARKFLEKENALLRNRTVLENQSYLIKSYGRRLLSLGGLVLEFLKNMMVLVWGI